jgi:hypothetical protein
MLPAIPLLGWQVLGWQVLGWQATYSARPKYQNFYKISINGSSGSKADITNTLCDIRRVPKGDIGNQVA